MAMYDIVINTNKRTLGFVSAGMERFGKKAPAFAVTHCMLSALNGSDPGPSGFHDWMVVWW